MGFLGRDVGVVMGEHGMVGGSLHILLVGGHFFGVEEHTSEGVVEMIGVLIAVVVDDPAVPHLAHLNK